MLCFQVVRYSLFRAFLNHLNELSDASAAGSDAASAAALRLVAQLYLQDPSMALTSCS